MRSVLLDLDSQVKPDGILDSVADLPAWWQDSKLIPYAAPVADVLESAAAEGMEYFDVDEGDAAGFL